MNLLANISIRTKFLLLPVIAALLMLTLGGVFFKALQNEEKLLGQITDQDVPKMRDLSRLFSEFSTNHVKFISLLASSLKGQAEEGEFYSQGRKNIVVVQNISTAFGKFEARFRLDERQQKIAKNLRQELGNYYDQMSRAIVMSSVELKLIAHFTLLANEAYDDANDEFLKFNDAVQESTQNSIVDTQSLLKGSEYQFFIILATTILFILIISMLLSNVFTADLKSTITVLSQLSEGDTNIVLSHAGRKDEFGAVDQAIRVFREALIHGAEAEQSLRLSEERFKTLYENNPLMLITVDAKGAVLSINKRGANQIGFTAQELIGSSVLDLVLEEDREDAAQMIKRCAMNPGIRRQCTLRKSHRDGNVIWLRQTGQAIMSGQESVILLACEDITETHRLSEQLSYQATHDGLTGLLNRWEFERRMIQVLDAAKSDCSEHVLCYLDLDQFKIINDTCGHGAGDELLKQLGDVLKSKIRSGDLLARLGGDEFGIMLESCSMSVGWKTAKTLLEAIEKFRFAWGDRQFRVGASIGMVLISELSDDVNDVMSNADAACYAAKDQGRNRIHVYTENDQELAQRRGDMLWASRIPEAIENDDFELFCQTISPISGKDEEGKHFEFLVRLKNNEGGWISPAQFLPAAERYNLSTRLDRWVVSTAFSSLSRFTANGVVINKCAINLSGNSLGDEEFLNFILEELDAHQVRPESICFEITETAAISNLRNAKIFIKRLKREGVYFALDDFGTGLSSFAYLKELPVDYLKIDGLFVREIANDPIQFAMVKSINDIGHVMGMRTVGEFVENEEIMAKLREIGVDYGQGYYIDKPCPASEYFATKEFFDEADLFPRLKTGN